MTDRREDDLQKGLCFLCHLPNHYAHDCPNQSHPRSSIAEEATRNQYENHPGRRGQSPPWQNLTPPNPNSYYYQQQWMQNAVMGGPQGAPIDNSHTALYIQMGTASTVGPITLKRRKVYIGLMPHNKEILALLDTWCEVSLISSSLAAGELRSMTDGSQPHSDRHRRRSSCTIQAQRPGPATPALMSDCIGEVMLGSDFSDGHECIWNFKDQSLTHASCTFTMCLHGAAV